MPIKIHIQGKFEEGASLFWTVDETRSSQKEHAIACRQTPFQDLNSGPFFCEPTFLPTALLWRYYKTLTFSKKLNLGFFAVS